MLSLQGVSAWVEVDGKELEQYGIEKDPGQNRVTCWIATQTDKTFSVIFRDDISFREHSLCSSLRLDGSYINGKVLFPPAIGNPHDGANRTVVQKDQVLSATSARPFVFSKLELTDDDEYLGQTSAHLGEIQIRVYRGQKLESYVYPPGRGVAGHAKVHERSKKAISHCVSYGQEVKTETRYTTNVRYLDGDVPLVTFNFKYRDVGLLQANGIIPQPPPAKKKAALPDDVLDLTLDNDIKPEPLDEEIEIVDNASVTRMNPLRSKKSDSGRESYARPAKRIKREKPFVQTGEVIDLT